MFFASTIFNATVSRVDWDIGFLWMWSCAVHPIRIKSIRFNWGKSEDDVHPYSHEEPFGAPKLPNITG